MILGSWDIKALYVNDPEYSKYIFNFTGVKIKFTDDIGLDVWFNVTAETIDSNAMIMVNDDLKLAAKKLLYQFINHFWMLYELDIDITAILDPLDKGEPLDIDTLSSYNKKTLGESHDI